MDALVFKQDQQIWLLLSNGLIEYFAYSSGVGSQTSQTCESKLKEYIRDYKRFIGDIDLINIREIAGNHLKTKDWSINGRMASTLFEASLVKYKLAGLNVRYNNPSPGIYTDVLVESRGDNPIKSLVLPDTALTVICSELTASQSIKFGKFTVDIQGTLAKTVSSITFGTFLFRLNNIFSNGSAIKTLKLPIGLREVERLALDECTELEEFDFSDCKNLRTLPQLLKPRCSGIKRIALPPNIKGGYNWATFGILDNIEVIAVPKGFDTYQISYLGRAASDRLKDGRCKLIYY